MRGDRGEGGAFGEDVCATLKGRFLGWGGCGCGGDVMAKQVAQQDDGDKGAIGVRVVPSARIFVQM